MKTVTSAAQTQINTLQGTEPLVIVGIEWTPNNVTYYCDKDIVPNVKGKILQLGSIQAVIVGENKQSQSVELVLDDTDGEIKQICDTVNIHKVDCTVYQYFNDLNDLNDKFVLMSGQISAPFTWNEKDRSVSFSIVSEIESYEVGFSPEEGQLPFVNNEFIGKPWPLVFGRVMHVPAARTSQTLTGRLLEPLGIIDPFLYYKIEVYTKAYNQILFLIRFWMMVINGADYLSRKAGDILTDYIKIIKQERSELRTLNRILKLIDDLQIKIKKGLVKNGKARLLQLQAILERHSNVLHRIQEIKARIEAEIANCERKYQLKKHAYQRITQLYNQGVGYYNEYVQTKQEICNQEAFVKSTVLTTTGDPNIQFTQGVETDVYIDTVHFKGIFDGNKLTITSGPYAKYTNLEVGPWLGASESCGAEDKLNGLSEFWLKENPPKSLLDCYMLVKARDGSKHILKVKSQIGQKVTFDLIKYAQTGTGGGHGTSIDSMIGNLYSVPFVATKLGFVPIDYFNGNWAASNWNRPEALRLLKIINSIPDGGPNQREAQLLAKLVFLAPWDEMPNDLFLFSPSAQSIYTVTGPDIVEVLEVSKMVLWHWFKDNNIPTEEASVTTAWQADVGATIRTNQDDCEIWIANILPSSIKGVFAYQKLHKTGERVLSVVPSNYYIKNESANLGTINVTSLVFRTALANIPGEGWENQIYVSMVSSVGPNVVDIIQWLIETYTVDGIADPTTFNALRTRFGDLYPANFAIFDQPNVLDEIARIAWEARCGIYRRGTTFYLKYLSREPSVNATLSESDICSSDDLQVAFPETGQIVTRLTAIWHPDYLPNDENHPVQKLVYRHNVLLYGLHKEEVDFHIYNIQELVEKSATFWLIRRSNSWKQLTFKTYIKNIRIDPFDCVEFTFSQKYVGNSTVKGIVLSSNYDTENNLIELTVELPIKTGEMEPYKWYWPGDQTAFTEFPLPIEIVKGYAGGVGPSAGVTGTIDGC